MPKTKKCDRSESGIIDKYRDDLEAVFELTVPRIKDTAFPDTPELYRSVLLSEPKFYGVQKGNTLTFRTKSQTRPPKTHIQKVVLLDLDKYPPKEALAWGDVKIHCGCEDFLFSGKQYRLTSALAAIKPETRFPEIRNPSLTGSLICKHMIKLARRLMEKDFRDKCLKPITDKNKIDIGKIAKAAGMPLANLIKKVKAKLAHLFKKEEPKSIKTSAEGRFESPGAQGGEFNPSFKDLVKKRARKKVGPKYIDVPDK